MKINPALVLAVIGGLAVFFYMQRRATPVPTQQTLLPGSAPEGWIERTPAGYTVPGTTSNVYDILT